MGCRISACDSHPFSSRTFRLAGPAVTFASFISHAFCVFSGLAVCFLLLYRDRSEEESQQQNIKKENDELKRSLSTSQSAFQSLDEKYSRQRGQLNVLQQLCDDWSSNRETNERERAQLESELQSRSQRVAELEREHRGEKEKRISLEDQVHQLGKENLSVKAAADDYWRGETSKIESSLSQKVQDIAQLASENQRVTEKMHEMAGRIAELEAELAAEKSLVVTATKNATGLEQEYVSIETALRGTNERLKELESKLAIETSEKGVALQNAVSLDKQNTVLEKECDTLRQKLTAYETIDSQMVTLRTQLGESEQQLARVSEQRDQSLRAEEATSIMASGLQKRLDNQESTIHLLRQNQDDALENLKHELSMRTEIESRFDARTQALRDDSKTLKEQLEAQLEAARFELEVEREKSVKESEMLTNRLTETKTEMSSRIVELEGKTNEHSQTIIKLEAGREQLQRELAESRSMLETKLKTEQRLGSRVNELEVESSDYTQSIVKLGTQREQLEQDLRHAREQMQSQLKRDSETIGELQRERENLKAELEEVHARMIEIQGQMDGFSVKASSFESAQNRIVDLEKQLESRASEATRLQAQSVELSRLRQQYHDSQSRQESLQTQLDELINRQIRRDAERVDHEATIRELHAKLEVNEETIRELRKERAMVLARIADQHQARQPESTIISFTQSLSDDNEGEDYDAEYGGRVRRDANRGMIFTEAPEMRDDLKRISGIAGVLEKRLNDFGVYTFRQVMEWKPEEIEEFSRLLAFRDRIVRDDWQGQARFFYNQKRKTIRAAAA